MGYQGEVNPSAVAAYIRWSTDDQTDGTTLEVQKESCTHYIQSQGWQFREDLCFVDEGYSGGSLDRPAMDALRAAVTRGDVSCVVVYKLDRLSRSVLDTVNLVLEEWEGRCHVKSTREPIDTTSPAGKMFFYMLVSYAEWERSVIRERTLSGKKKRAEQGKNPGIKWPFGLKRGDKPGEWAVDEDQATIVRRIFQEYTAGKGLLTIANELNADGVPSKFGSPPWRISTIQYMLQNEAYKGVLIYGATIKTKSRKTGKIEVEVLNQPRHARVEGALPVIVDPVLWDAVQVAHKQRAIAGRRTLSAEYLLSGIAKCRCGAPLVGGLVDHRYRMYSCAARRNQGATVCSARGINADDVERDVIAAVRAHYSSSNEEGFVASVLSELSQEHQVAVSSLTRWHEKIDALKRRLQRLHSDYDAGELTGRVYSSRVEEIEADLQRVRGEVDALDQRLLDLDGRMHAVEALRLDFKHLAGRVDDWSSLTSEEQKQVLRHTIDSVSVWCVSKDRDPVDRRRVRQVVEVDMVLRRALDGAT